jgi:hypothetical protein
LSKCRRAKCERQHDAYICFHAMIVSPLRTQRKRIRSVFRTKKRRSRHLRWPPAFAHAAALTRGLRLR